MEREREQKLNKKKARKANQKRKTKPKQVKRDSVSSDSDIENVPYIQTILRRSSICAPGVAGGTSTHLDELNVANDPRDGILFVLIGLTFNFWMKVKEK